MHTAGRRNFVYLLLSHHEKVGNATYKSYTYVEHLLQGNMQHNTLDATQAGLPRHL
jgi:hypothetical protein